MQIGFRYLYKCTIYIKYEKNYRNIGQDKMNDDVVFFE